MWSVHILKASTFYSFISIHVFTRYGFGKRKLGRHEEQCALKLDQVKSAEELQAPKGTDKCYGCYGTAFGGNDTK